MADSKVVTMVFQHCDNILKTPIDELVANPDWGRIKFDMARPALETLVGIANQLKALPIELLPDQEINPVRDRLGNAVDLIERIRKFSVEQGNPAGARDEIVNQLRSVSDQVYVECQNRVPFLALQKGDVQRNAEKLNKAVQEAGQRLEDAKKVAADAKQSVDDIIGAAREASASVGVAHFTADFGREATEYETKAVTWLRWTSALALLTIVLAFAMTSFYPIIDTEITPRVIQLLTTKLVAIGLMLTATLWCARIYKTTKHLAAMNKHRSNALKTFQAFVKAASDEGTRNAVLLETTHAIFAPSQSGYLDGSESTNDGPTRVLEVVRNAADHGDSKTS